MRHGANIRQEGRGAAGSFHTLAGWSRMPRVIANGRRLFHGALDTFDYSHDRCVCVCVCVCVCATHIIANAIRGEWNKQPRLRSSSKCPKGEECGCRINITCKTHKVSRIFTSGPNRYFQSLVQQAFCVEANVCDCKKKMALSIATPSFHSSTSCHRVIFSSKIVVFVIRKWSIIEVRLTPWPGHSGERDLGP